MHALDKWVDERYTFWWGETLSDKCHLDDEEQNRLFNIATTKAKKELMALKESKSIPQDLHTWDIIPLISKEWVSSFDQVNKNKNTIADRRWDPLNCVIYSLSPLTKLFYEVVILY